MNSVVIIVEQLPIIVLQNNKLVEGSVRDEILRTKIIAKKNSQKVVKQCRLPIPKDMVVDI